MTNEFGNDDTDKSQLKNETADLKNESADSARELRENAIEREVQNAEAIQASGVIELRPPWTVESLKEFAEDRDYPELENAKAVGILYSAEYANENKPDAISLPPEYNYPTEKNHEAWAIADYFCKHPEAAQATGLCPEGMHLVSLGETKAGKEISSAIKELEDKGIEFDEREIWDRASARFAKQADAAAKEKGHAVLGFTANTRDDSTFKKAEEPELKTAIIFTDAPLSDGEKPNSIDARVFRHQLDEEGRIIAQ